MPRPIKKPLVNDINKALDSATDGLDMTIQSRLTQARSRAVETITIQRPVWTTPIFWAGTLSVALAITTVMLDMKSVSPSADTTTVNAVVPVPWINEQDRDVLLSNEELELLEDMEIYEWLANEYHRA